MIEDALPQPNPLLVKLFYDFNKVRGNIQHDISRVLLTDKSNQAELSKQLNGSENDMEVRMNKAVHAFLGAMPLAQMNRVNLFGKALALHSNLTGDSTMHDVFDEVNRMVYDEPEN